MTREEIINEINCLLSELDNGDDAVSYLTRNDVNWLNENIKALKQEAKWIPVTERLPAEEGFYLVTRRITDDVATFIFRRTPTSKDYWKRCVTAWMPLPEPYKGGQEDGKA